MPPSVGVTRQAKPGERREPRAYHAYYYDTFSCGQWLVERRGAVPKASGDMSSGDPSLGKTMWLLGWVSAAGLYHATPLRHTDQAAIKAWIDQYCTAHPLEELVEAATALVEALRQK